MRFLLDTNVLSAMMTVRETRAVATWLSAQNLDSLFTTTISQAEILAGLAVMPEGRRRPGLLQAANAMFAEDFFQRVWTFNGAAANADANLFGERQRIGRPIAILDLMIAAIARTQGATVVTRNVADFSDCDVAIENPWDV